MTTAQAVFVVALSAVALAIVAFGVFVASSPWWSDRWYRRRREGR